MTQKNFIEEVKKILIDEKSFNFNLKSAVVNHDLSKEFYHEFLVPDEGFSSFIKLHDKLYSKQLRKYLLLDIDFIPHIGIGNDKNSDVCKNRIDKLNNMELNISGKIDEIDIINYKDEKVETIGKILLK